MEESIRVQHIRQKVEGKHFELESELPENQEFVCICGTAGTKGIQLREVESGCLLVVSRRCAERYCGITLRRRKGRRVRPTTQFLETWSVKE